MPTVKQHLTTLRMLFDWLMQREVASLRRKTENVPIYYRYCGIFNR